jgi:hypothetical protein
VAIHPARQHPLSPLRRLGSRRRRVHQGERRDGRGICLARMAPGRPNVAHDEGLACRASRKPAGHILRSEGVQGSVPQLAVTGPMRAILW